MLRTIAHFGVVAERTMAAVYHELARAYPPDSDAFEVLTRISEEERVHAEGMEMFFESLSGVGIESSKTLLTVLDKQAAFAAEAMDVLVSFQRDEIDKEEVVERSIVLERSLAEGLLPRLLPMVDPAQRAAIRGLMEQTVTHEECLRRLV